MLLALAAHENVAASEIYHWVDENGVSNFSQVQPAGETLQVSKVVLADTSPPDYDPEEDRYGIKAQAERMTALREEMAARREANSNRQQKPTQQAVQYRDPYRNYGWPIRYPVYPPRPPVKPEPPIAVPYETATLRPPGRPSDR